MSKLSLFIFMLGVSMFFLPAGNAQETSKSTATGSAQETAKSIATGTGTGTSSKSSKSTSTHSAGFNVCQGTFAACMEATCKPITSNGQISSFQCECKVGTGYSLGVNGPKNNNSCQSIPQAPPAEGQKIPSRYSPVTNFVACTNKRPWAMCMDAACTVHADKNDPQKYSATCSCPKAEGGPYVYMTVDGQYSRSGCEDQYISSAPATTFLQVTQFLTTPKGKDLPAVPVTILVPSTGQKTASK
ncbi:MAG TPA: hypothetical protein VKZ53_00495 [Candidatus Angelobacter sp.]|nr:hypothetical protein [Candidatus Angelobacter sp.]